jgi:ABC-type Mn2+/Zn2+ transport system permease subunit
MGGILKGHPVRFYANTSIAVAYRKNAMSRLVLAYILSGLLIVAGLLFSFPFHGREEYSSVTLSLAIFLEGITLVIYRIFPEKKEGDANDRE